MTAPIREQVLTAIMARLDSMVENGKPYIDRNITTPVEQFPTVGLRDGGHSVPAPTTSQKKFDMTFGIELFVTADKDKDLGPALNALYGQVINTLEVEDFSLGGLIQDISEQELVEVVALQMEGGKPAMTATIVFGVTFYTKPFDAFANGI